MRNHNIYYVVKMKSMFIDYIPDEVFYKLRELKAKWRCKTWREFLAKVVENESKV